MAENSNIGWTQSTFNPWRGCTRVSDGCKSCYADTLSKRNPEMLGKWGPKGTRVVASEAMWNEPIKWNRKAEKDGVRRRVFCASLSDVFEDWNGPMHDHTGKIILDDCGFEWFTSPKPERHPQLTMDAVRTRLFRLIDRTPNLDWLLLTKRPENIRKMWPMRRIHADDQDHSEPYPRADDPTHPVRAYYRRNVWNGTSVENQEYAEKCIPELLKCRDLSPVLFLSAEPLLGPVDLRQCNTHEGHRDVLFVGNEGGYEYSGSKRNFINWVIAGAESGSKRRPANIDWFRSLRDQCKNAGVPFFMKQMESNGKITDNMADFPEDLRIQEYPDGSGQ